MLDPIRIRKDFPMFENHLKMQNHPLVFLDNASTTFKPQCVLDAVESYYTRYTSNSHRGDYDLCFYNDQMIAEARHTVAQFIQCEDNEVVFTSGTTMSINTIAYGYGLKHLHKGGYLIVEIGYDQADRVSELFRNAGLSGVRVIKDYAGNDRVVVGHL